MNERDDGRRASVYLDHNATAPLCAEARAAMVAVLADPGNPSSVHRDGRRARHAVERARRQVADFLGAAPEEVIFTSGGTEADILALRGMPGRRVIVSAIEHDAVLDAVPGACHLPVSRDAVVDLEILGEQLARLRDPAIVSIMWANNETGTIQPLGEAAVIARRHGAIIHSDAVQAAGKLPIDFASLDLDMMSISAHKFGGPPGVGALLVRQGLVLEAVQTGGGQESGRRAGTENLPGIVGFGATAAVADQRLARMAAVRSLRDRLEASLLAAAPDARVLCAGVARLPNTSCIVMPGVSSETQVMAFDLDGISVSAGSACNSGRVVRSHVIEAMEPGQQTAGTALRISLGPENTAADVDRLVAAWLRLYKRARAI